MCGITGFWLPEEAPEVDLLSTVRSMADTLAHRGPDDSGEWVDASPGLALGFRRLAIIDLTPSGAQPMQSNSGRYVIVFNGEVYNFGALRAELERQGHRFRGGSDTEVMLEAVEQWGVERAVSRFIGQFAFALWDRQKHNLYLVRDRLGIKPLYYGWMGPTLVFGSELKALKANPLFENQIDRNSLTLYFRYNYIPAPYAIYEGIRKQLPGTILTFRSPNKDDVTETTYWSARAVAEEGVSRRFNGTAQETIDELERRLTDSVELRMIADVPLGAFLSGGIDSSTTVALMQGLSNRPVKTFTIGFHEGDYDEAAHARKVAAHLGTDHTELYVSPEEAQAVIHRLPKLYDEPFADSSQIPTFLISQLARRDVTVSLSGDGGDELFGGYNRYFRGRTIWNRAGKLPSALRRVGARAITSVSPQSWDRSLAVLEPAIPPSYREPMPGDKLHKLAEVLAVDSPESMYHGLVSHWREPDNVVLGGMEPVTLLTDRSQWARLSDFTERMMYLDLLTYLPNDILTKVDRASMGVSLEARVPLLDHRVVEFAWSLPLSLKVSNGTGKWALRHVLYRHVPRELIERPKMGFGVPIEDWLRGPLQEWAEELLSVERINQEGFLDPEPIRAKWEEHLTGKRNWHYQLWDVLMFQAWLEDS
ncbi:MAG: asparagine synthase (glutamine-hydrolyzing) [Anaerolineales bacterium]